MSEEININITKNEPEEKKGKEASGKLQFDLDLGESKAPILEAGQIGQIIVPVKVISVGKEKAKVEQNGPVRTQGDFDQQTASQLKESLPKAER